MNQNEFQIKFTREFQRGALGYLGSQGFAFTKPNEESNVNINVNL